jgi:type II secretory pathway pseudopilin PulG
LRARGACAKRNMISFSSIPGLKKIILRLGSQRGIGLVESLVAIAILGVGVTAFVTDLSAGSMAVNVQNENTLAQGLAQTQMEVIKAAPYDNTGRSYLPVEAPENYTIEIAAGYPAGEKGSMQESLQQVSVTIKHNADSVLTLEGYKVKR